MGKIQRPDGAITEADLQVGKKLWHVCGALNQAKPLYERDSKTVISLPDYTQSMMPKARWFKVHDFYGEDDNSVSDGNLDTSKLSYNDNYWFDNLEKANAYVVQVNQWWNDHPDEAEWEREDRRND